jgi:hypothetical protein
MSPKEILTNVLGLTPREADNLISEFEAVCGPLPLPTATNDCDQTKACAAEINRQKDEAVAAPAAFTISVNGRQGAGKTTLLLVILKALADADLLNDTDMHDAVFNPRYLLNRARTMDGLGEAIDVRITQSAIRQVQTKLEDGQSPFGEPATLDDILPTLTGAAICERFATRDEIATIGVKGVLSQMVEEAFETVVIDADAKDVLFRVNLG